MERFVTKKAEPKKTLPEDIYPAKLIKVKPITDKKWPGVRMTFRPLVEKYADLSASCAAWGQYDENHESYIEEGSKLDKWLLILNGGESYSGMKPEDMVGAKCRIDVVHSEPDKDENVWANVMRILPYKSAADDETEERPKRKPADETEERPRRKPADELEDEQPRKKPAPAAAEEKPRKPAPAEDEFDEPQPKKKPAAEAAPEQTAKKKTDEVDDIFKEEDDDF